MFGTRRDRFCMIGVALSVFACMRAASEDSVEKKVDEPLRLYCVLISGVTPTSTSFPAEVSLGNNGQGSITHEFKFRSFDYLKFELLDQDGKSLAISWPEITRVSDIDPEKPLTQDIEPGKWIRREFYPLTLIDDAEKHLKDEAYYQVVAIMGVKCRNKDGTTTIHDLKSNPAMFRFGMRKSIAPKIEAPAND